MKRLVTISALVAILLGIAQVSYLYFGRSAPQLSLSPASETQLGMDALNGAGGPLDLPVGLSQTVDFFADETTFRDYTIREREDQYRDWLLFASVAALHPSPEDYNKIFFDLPTTRHGYMRPVGNFEFGETRSRFIGNGRALALIPAGRSVAERKDFLAHIADEQRKNQGGKFDRLIVVEYELDRTRQRGALTRRDDVEYAPIFSAEYGYHEREVTKLTDLEQFMVMVDDLTFVQKVPNGLVLGGRKTLSWKYRPIQVEQVATIWKSEKQIQEAQSAVADFDARWKYRTYRKDDEMQRQQLQEEHDREWSLLESKLRGGRRDLKLVKGSGFSLDPGGDSRKLREALEEWQSSQAMPARLKSIVSSVSQALVDGNTTPFVGFTQSMVKRGDPKMARELKHLEREYLYQVARYDGELQGTEVGMILFYTDLLAKLWTMDFISSSPRHDPIPVFVDDRIAPNSSIYAAERHQLNSGRLWFGLSNLGFQIADQKNAVYLARNATRLYSAASDPDQPGKEVAFSAFMAASTEWWNDHYEEVARYEQEYERLNQIMKWSIVISWLNELNEGTRLSFLANVDIDRSKVFPQWASHHPELRFQRWRDIGFYEAGHKGTTTETLPTLWGEVTGGGVSLASKEGVAKRAPIPVEVEKTILRSNLDYATSTGNTVLKTLDETVFTLKSRGANQFSVIAQAKPGAKFRATTAQLAHADIERTLVAHTDTVSFEPRVGGVPTGNLEIGRSSNGFRIGWRAREIDHAHSLARELSVALDPDLVLLNDPMVEAVVKFPGDATYAAKLHGSTQWVRLAPEQKPSVDIAAGWQLRAAEDSGQAIRNMQASIVDEVQLEAAIGTHQTIVVENSAGGKTLLHVSPDQPPDGAHIVEIQDGKFSVAAWIQSPSDRIHLSIGSQEGLGAVAMAKRLGPAELNTIRNAGPTSNTLTIPISQVSRLRAKLPEHLGNREFRKAAAEIVKDPDSARLVLQEGIKLDIKNNVAILKTRGINEALHDLDRLIDMYGNHPDLTLRRGLFLIERGNIEASAESIQTTAPRMISDRRSFFDEVNARLADRPNDMRGNLHRFAQYADWQHQMAQSSNKGQLGGSVRPLAVGNHFDFEFQLAAIPSTQPISLSELAQSFSAKAAVYRQDSVALNRLDWTAPVDQALRQVITGDLGKVVRLPQQDIGHFRPSAVWLPDDAIRLNAVQPHRYTSHIPSHGYQSCAADTEICSKGDSDQKQDEKNVYLVLAN